MSIKSTLENAKETSRFVPVDELIGQPLGFDNFPAFPSVTFPNLSPSFDKKAFDSFKCKFKIFIRHTILKQYNF